MGQTDKRSAALHLPDTSVLWPLGGKRVRCWCIALCRDSGVQRWICYFVDIWM